MSFRILLLLLLTPLLCFGKYYSQIGQDKLVNTRYFKNKKNGVFVDIGAHNGITFSNSYYFENELKWQGLCIEPIPEIFDKLLENRACTCIKGCVTDFTGKGEFVRVTSPQVTIEMLSGLLHKYDPRHLEKVQHDIEKWGGSFEIIDVDCYLLNDLLEKYDYHNIDFLSLDTEGGEFDILATIDFSKYIIDVITLEDNYNDERFIPFLESKGYVFVERHNWDLLFVRKDFYKQCNNRHSNR